MQEETGTEREPNHILRHQRELRGWSRKRMAEELQLRYPGIAVTEKEVARWERGKRTPGPYYREKLCALFQKTAVDLGFVERTSIHSARELVSEEEDNEQAVPQQSNTSILRLTTEQLAVLRVVLGEKGMAYFDPSKRETLRQIAVAIGAIVTGTQVVADPEPWERLSAAQKRSAKALNAEAFDRFEHLIGEAWQLSNINELEAAEGIVASFLPKIQAIPPSEINARIALIASQGLRLQSVLIHHRLHIANKILMCQRSVEYARFANDANTLVTALIELATAYEFSNQPEKCFLTLQEALFHASQASHLIQSRVYSNNAIHLANSKRTKEAELYIGLAHEVFPEDPSLDPAYALADASVFMLSHHTGLAHLNNGQLHQAFDAFEFYKKHSGGTNIPERIRLEIVNGLSKAAIQAGDLERYSLLFEDAIVGSTRLGSKKRFDEAISIFQQEIPSTWRAHSHIKDLTEKYRLESTHAKYSS